MTWKILLMFITFTMSMFCTHPHFLQIIKSRAEQQCLGEKVLTKIFLRISLPEPHLSRELEQNWLLAGMKNNRILFESSFSSFTVQMKITLMMNDV
ncbi:hypothetical protein CEXT_482511 [Caerostris extrusa]|uniref:Secreted protein n=1 Tax=Caerostris extrusa TaxID=172846 RepID=A0AAV4MHK5_CAEEX|nr:hypothetical protein CEXT_482511 [Caerostris extrusa]